MQAPFWGPDPIGSKFGPSTFGVFDDFADQAGRNAHPHGQIAAALMANTSALLAEAPKIGKIDPLAAKLPGRSNASRKGAGECVAIGLGSAEQARPQNRNRGRACSSLGRPDDQRSKSHAINTTAISITSTAPQAKNRVLRFTGSDPITVALPDRIIIATMIGTATTPLTTALQ